MDSSKPGIDRLLGIRPIDDPSRIPERRRRQIGLAASLLAGLFFGPFMFWFIRQAMPELDSDTLAWYLFGGVVVGVVIAWACTQLAKISLPLRLSLSTGLLGLYLLSVAGVVFVTHDAPVEMARKKWQLAKSGCFELKHRFPLVILGCLRRIQRCGFTRK